VFGHQDQLEQVLINLMVNARDALLEQRRAQPWIRVRQTLQGSRLCLVVEDNGGGIDPHLLERIFEPFFTTKPAGVGTGLGLSVSHGIVSHMGGSLSVANSDEGVFPGGTAASQQQLSVPAAATEVGADLGVGQVDAQGLEQAIDQGSSSGPSRFLSSGSRMAFTPSSKPAVSVMIWPRPLPLVGL
jgi:signal transduction histidine kinase